MTEMNTGSLGGDLASRRFAFAVTIAIAVMAIPQVGVTDGKLRLMALLVGMSGTLFLMAGLVFLQKTHYAGVMLLPVASAAMTFLSFGSRAGIIVSAVIFGSMMAANLKTRRCSVNQALGINSNVATAREATPSAI